MFETTEEIAEALQGERLEEVAADTGLSYFTLVRYRNNQVKHPRLDTVRRLSKWAKHKESQGAAAR